jgi:hypothetical protein
MITTEVGNIIRKLDYMCTMKCVCGCRNDYLCDYGENSENAEDMAFEKAVYCAMAEDGTLACYDVVTSEKAFKTLQGKKWYGHLNFVVLKKELYDNIKDSIRETIPEFVGVAYSETDEPENVYDVRVSIACEAERQDLSPQQELMVKDTLIKSQGKYVRLHKGASDSLVYKEVISQLKEVALNAKYENEQYDKYHKELSAVYRAAGYYGIYENFSALWEGLRNCEVELPKKITLTLTDEGREYNKKVAELDRGIRPSEDEEDICRGNSNGRKIENTLNYISSLPNDEEYDLSAPIEDLELSVRTFNCLKRGGVRQIKELIGVKMSDLQKLKNFSKKCADELNRVLKEKTGYEIEGEWVDEEDE